MVMPDKSGSSTPKRISMLRRLCCASNGIKKILYIMSCWNRPKLSLVIVIDYNWYDWNKLWKKNDRNGTRGTSWFCYMTTLGYTLQNRLSSTWKEWSEKFYPIHWTLLLQISICSSPCSRPFLESDTIIIKVSKNGLDEWIASKESDFFLREICFIRNVGESSMEHILNELILFV